MRANTLGQVASKDELPIPKTFSQLVELYTKYTSSSKEKNSTILCIHPNTISPNPLTSSFKMTAVGGFIFHKYPIHEKLCAAFAKTLSTPSVRKYYYEGPQSIGKSFALLYLVVLLRSIP